jgi:3-oxoacyl-[acyl-carrier-protein] synthase-3
LNTPNLTRDELLKLLPTFTLGCGAVACVLCHESISKHKHHIRGAACRSATQFNDLCEGNVDYCIGGGGEHEPLMSTESSKLIPTAAKLGGRTWPDASETLGWTREEVNHVFCHQVGKQVNEAFYKEMGLDFEKEFTIYRQYGNLVSAALPTCFAMGVENKPVEKGDKVILTAFGSGLNARFIGVQW